MLPVYLSPSPIMGGGAHTCERARWGVGWRQDACQGRTPADAGCQLSVNRTLVSHASKHHTLLLSAFLAP